MLQAGGRIGRSLLTCFPPLCSPPFACPVLFSPLFSSLLLTSPLFSSLPPLLPLFFSRYTAAYSLQAVGRIGRSLLTCFHEPTNLGAREEMLLASCVLGHGARRWHPEATCWTCWHSSDNSAHQSSCFRSVPFSSPLLHLLSFFSFPPSPLLPLLSFVSFLYFPPLSPSLARSRLQPRFEARVAFTLALYHRTTLALL